jgi:prepilin-type N-terminal cleavage/methylation domain-containing protein
MKRNTFHRLGFTLLELLVVIAITAILLGLLLAGITKVREAGYQVESKNNLRQIILAVHHFADTNKGNLPLIPVGQQIGTVIYPGPSAPSLFLRILPYMDEGNVILQIVNSPKPFPSIRFFTSPADPTAQEALEKGMGVSSYAANSQVFRDNPRLPVTFADGTSNTITFAEHYSYNCQGYTFIYWKNKNQGAPIHRPTFADDGDVVPITKGNPPVTSSSGDPLTFQIAPAIQDCFPGVAQTPHRNGMLVALGDGSVRILAGGMSINTYWAAVTPAGGEVLGNDWLP